ncbi:MAG: M48 family metalloprotease [Verrucomicrobia bacterium]|nr:M48 family metalloprotease [Verrucomicrobiota bacterium]
MNRETYHALVESLTARAAANPAGYRRKVALLAGGGYAYLLALLLLVVALFWLCYWIYQHTRLSGGSVKLMLVIGIFAGVLAWAILRGIFTRLPPPDGVRVSREEAPELHAVVDELSRQLGVKPVSRIYLDNDFNAAAVQRPLFGLFGPVRNWLVLGVPLMDALSRDELRSVIAHEFGHFGGQHGRFSGWIYRMRAAWGSLLQAASGGSSALDLLITPFLKWYVPRLNAWTFVLVRAQEFEADAAGARAAGPEVAGRALVKASVLGRLCAEIGWKGIFRQAATEAAPPRDTVERFRTLLRAGPEPTLGQRWLGAALQAHTTLDDTHPCLRERLAGLGVPQVASEVPSAAQPPSSELLGPRAAELRARVEAEWSERFRSVWMMRHFELQQVRERLAEVESHPAPRPPEEELQRASLLLDLQDDERAQAVLSALLTTPDLPSGLHASAAFLLGSLRLRDDDPAGVPLVEEAMRLDPVLTSDALENLRAFHERNGRIGEARSLYEQLDREDAQLELAGKERNELTNRDTLEPHRLSAAELTGLLEQLARHPRIRQAWLARKQVQHYATRPLYVLLLEADGTWLDSSKSEFAGEIVAGTSFPGETLVLVGKAEPKKLLQRLREDVSARIYARPG